MDRAQLEKILTEGRSDLLQGFVSNRNHRKFKAFLVLDKKTGKIGFEFQPRAAEAPASEGEAPARKTSATHRASTGTKAKTATAAKTTTRARTKSASSAS